jgi:phenylalanyl-tRNA synthetase alpha chain
MDLTFTDAQKQRLKELMLEEEELILKFKSSEEREEVFKKISYRLTTKNKERLELLRSYKKRPDLRKIESKLVSLLTSIGFTEVVTPIILSRGLLERMNIHEGDHLWNQIFWIDRDHCLRPMLAPNLYFLLGHLGRLWPRPIRIFEIGPCFRKESKGARHLPEFTMLNLVELSPEKDPEERLKELITKIMDALEMEYELSYEDAECYGKTLDVHSRGIEIGSGVAGPHELDKNWGIYDPWAGIGFGIERIILAKEGFANIKKIGRSLIYLDCVRLDII